MPHPLPPQDGPIAQRQARRPMKPQSSRRIATLVCLAIALPIAEHSRRAIAADFPGEEWTAATPAEAGLDAAKLEQAREYALTGGGSGCIVRGGKLVFAWGDPAKRCDLKSTTKSFGAAALGLAIKDGKLRLEDKARQHHPTIGTPPESHVQTGWLDEITKNPAAFRHCSLHPARNGTTATAVRTGSPSALRSRIAATWTR